MPETSSFPIIPPAAAAPYAAYRVALLEAMAEDILAIDGRTGLAANERGRELIFRRVCAMRAALRHAEQQTANGHHLHAGATLAATLLARAREAA